MPESEIPQKLRRKMKPAKQPLTRIEQDPLLEALIRRYTRTLYQLWKPLTCRQILDNDIHQILIYMRQQSAAAKARLTGSDAPAAENAEEAK